MRIVLYDPLYSNIGHYRRYSEYMVELFCSVEKIEEVVYFTEMPGFIWEGVSNSKLKIMNISSELNSIQEQSISSTGAQRFSLGFKAFRHYIKILREMKKEKCDMNLFLSQGIFSLWIALLFVRIKYSVSIISIKWLFEKGYRKILRKLFISFLKKANGCIFTEEVYVTSTQNLKLRNKIVLPDRYLSKKSTNSIKKNVLNSKINLVTLGTISVNKNPMNFIKEFCDVSQYLQNQFNYNICGKVLDSGLEELYDLTKMNSNILFRDEYLTATEFNYYTEISDFVVIPYPSEYTNYATSGIMWDCFTKRKSIICPDNKLFNYYINKYGIGYTYKDGELESVLELVAKNKKELINNDSVYDKLFKENSFDEMKRRITLFLSNDFK